MQTISTEDIQRDPRELLRQVEAGQTVRIVRGGRTVAEVRPASAGDTDVKEPRPFGLCAGEFTVPDDFDEPLPEEILREFEGR